MSHTAEIIAVGTELLLGNIANTNAQDVSCALSALGINVYFHTVVGDNPERLRQAAEIAKGRADIIITTGGLGPTLDDLTKQTLADTFGKRLVYDEEQAEIIKSFFRRRAHGAPMTENNLRQAMLPEGCVVFSNGCGTAPGCAFEADGTHVLMLPGPPRECRAMLETCVVPYLKKLSQFEIRSRNIHIFGLGESAVEARLHTLMESMENPTLAPYAKEGEVMLRLTARARGEDEADALMAPVLERVKSALGDIIYGIDSQSLENSVIELLRAAGKTVAVAESCTGGLIAKRLTDIPGASEVFPGGVTAYSAQAKVSLLGVAPDVLKRYGAVSRETAVAMADGARARFGADVGLAATGIAGPDGDGSGLPPGTVFVALAFEGGAYCRRPGIFRADDRAHTRALSASHAFDMLRRYLTGLPVEVAVF